VLLTFLHLKVTNQHVHTMKVIMVPCDYMKIICECKNLMTVYSSWLMTYGQAGNAMFFLPKIL